MLPEERELLLDSLSLEGVRRRGDGDEDGVRDDDGDDGDDDDRGDGHQNSGNMCVNGFVIESDAKVSTTCVRVRAYMCVCVCVNVRV